MAPVVRPEQIEELETNYTMQCHGGSREDLQYGILEQSVRGTFIENTQQVNLICLGQFVVNTEWTESVDEAEELMELPHPVPVRPEASPAPSFVETKKTDEREEHSPQREEDDEQQSQQVSPVPSKKPERFTSSQPSSQKSSAVKMSSAKRIKKDPSTTSVQKSPDLQ